jgi:proton-translocating NADH-quinone oxidoreductase chain L
MLLLLVLLPLFGFLGGVFFGRFLNTAFVATTSVFLSFIISLSFFFDILITNVNYKIIIGSWIDISYLNITWSFLFDSLTGIMLIVVTFISTLVHLYSVEYMENDPHLSRFMSYLSLFTFLMLILITADNFLQMFVGWEGVGLSSYLLINFWFTRIQANKAAIKAMLVNRIGDFALLISIFIIFYTFKTLNYDIIFNSIFEIDYFSIKLKNISFSNIDCICLLLSIGAMGKSAQLGLHIWLPDAMEGPTPVSALIHAATMVTAGIFLIARCSYLFELSPVILNLITLVGASTAFAAATIGLFQNDIKKVIAYSTCSQLGYMFFACGLSTYEVGLFHLSNHAFFKALLFLGAGSVIHAINDEQDMRKMGGLRKLLPFSYAMILIGSLALMGFPFLTGFYSKDIILEVAYAKYTTIGHYAYFLGVLAAFCTAFYSIRLLYLVFLSFPNGNRVILFNTHESTWKITLPLGLLCFFSINIGYLTKEFFIGFGTDFWGSSLFVLPSNYILIDSEFIPTNYKILPLLFTIVGSILSFFLYNLYLKEFFSFKINNNFIYILITNLNRKWFFDRIYTEILTQNILKKAYFFSYQILDRGYIEQFGPYGFIQYIKNLSRYFILFQTGLLYHYLLFFIFSIFFIYILLLFFI